MNRFSRNTNISEAWRKLGVPTSGISQASRWHDPGSCTWTLWLETPHGVNFESLDRGAKLVLTPWVMPEPGEESDVRRGKNQRYWDDLRQVADEGRLIRILAIKWRKDANGKFVEDQHGATIPVYWREMFASMHEDGTRIVLTQAVVEPPK